MAERAREKAASLSGGQQRLVEFARSLMLDPLLVVLDEPSMGLDPRTSKNVFQTVRQMNSSGRTVLLVEQNARAGLRMSLSGYSPRERPGPFARHGPRGLDPPRNRGAVPGWCSGNQLSLLYDPAKSIQIAGIARQLAGQPVPPYAGDDDLVASPRRPVACG